MPDAHARTEITLSDAERAKLTSVARSRSLSSALAPRARVVLPCEGQGKASIDVAGRLGMHRATVMKWRKRCARDRIAGLYDELRRAARWGIFPTRRAPLNG